MEGGPGGCPRVDSASSILHPRTNLAENLDSLGGILPFLHEKPEKTPQTTQREECKGSCSNEKPYASLEFNKTSPYTKNRIYQIL